MCLLLRSIFKKKKTVYILKTCREIGQSFEESIRGDTLVKFRYIYSIWLLHDVKNYSDLGGCYPPRPDNILLDLHYSVHHTQFS